jgi:hypothetical protein
MRSHRLLRLEDNKSATSCYQICSKLQNARKFDKSCFINLQQVCQYQVAASPMFTDSMQFDKVNRVETTCWQLASGQ